MGKDSITFDQAVRTASAFVDIIRAGCAQVEIAGSVRREKPFVKDIEIVAISRVDGGVNLLNRQLDTLLHYDSIELARYGKAGKSTTRWGRTYRGLVYQGVRIEVFQATPPTWGYIQWLRTGPGDANKHVMQMLVYYRAPYHCRAGAVWAGDHQIVVPTEQEMFRLLGMPYLNPPDRTLERYAGYLGRNGWASLDSVTFVDAASAPQQLDLFGGAS